jgi:hypothetical protein
MSDRLRWPAVIAISALAMDILVLGAVHGPGPLRLLVALWFMFMCTGMSFVPLLAVPSLATALLLGVLASIVLDTLAATAMVLVGGLSATSGLIALQVICLAGCTLQLVPQSRGLRSHW